MSNTLEPILLHAEAGDIDAIRAIDEADLPKKLRKRDEDTRTALHIACAAGHKEVAEYLLSKGADVNLEDEEGWSPLHSCASKGDAVLVGLLLDAKADPDAATSSKATSLHFAASKGHTEVLALLLNAGAKKNARDRHGGTPLLRAVSCGRERALKVLLEAKADVALKDSVGDNALHVAINGQHVNLCEALMGRDEAEAMMLQDNDEGKSPAKLILDMVPIGMRDTIKSIWRATHGG